MKSFLSSSLSSLPIYLLSCVSSRIFYMSLFTLKSHVFFFYFLLFFFSFNFFMAHDIFLLIRRNKKEFNFFTEYKKKRKKSWRKQSKKEIHSIHIEKKPAKPEVSGKVSFFIFCCVLIGRCGIIASICFLNELD